VLIAETSWLLQPATAGASTATAAANSNLGLEGVFNSRFLPQPKTLVASFQVSCTELALFLHHRVQRFGCKGSRLPGAIVKKGLVLYASLHNCDRGRRQHTVALVATR
jgi:hypothetical protein